MARRRPILRDPARQRGKDTSSEHWMGLGQFGQDALLHDFDPTLYALDQALNSAAVSQFHRLGRREERPLALIVPPEDSLIWHVGRISELFQVGLWQLEPDPVIDDILNRFGASLVQGPLADLPELLALVILLQHDWVHAGAWLHTVQTCAESLEEEGMLLALLKVRAQGDSGLVQWQDGSETNVADLQNDLCQEFKSVDNRRVELTPKILSDDEYLSEFLRRHRSFFGRNARELCLARMSEDDFAPLFRDGSHQALLFICEK